MEDVVERVVTAASRRLADELTLDELAKMAMFSKFHFARAFRQVTGVSPGRFLSAMRLHEAKRLLVTTSLTVADISCRVGYASVGTFTSRFSASVGVPPGSFRRLGGCTPVIAAGDVLPDPRGATVTGWISTPRSAFHGSTFVGVFPGPVPEGRPTRCTVLERTDRWAFVDLPPGRWFVLAVSVSPLPTGTALPLAGERPTMVGRVGPVDILPGMRLTDVEVRLKPMRRTDPPVLLALLDPTGADRP